jgi:hypothetical protein
MGVFGVSERWQVYIILNIIMCSIGIIASSLNIAVIYRMKMSGYLLLLLTMSFFQFAYDASSFFSNVNCGYGATVTANMFQILGGIGGGLISNFIALTVLYIVWYRKSLDIYFYYPFMLLFSFVVAATYAIVYVISTVPKDAHPDLEKTAVLGMYNTTREGCILVNFIVFGVTAYNVWRIGSNGSGRTEAEKAITTLSRRLIYYPIVQVPFLKNVNLRVQIFIFITIFCCRR